MEFIHKQPAAVLNDKFLYNKARYFEKHALSAANYIFKTSTCIGLEIFQFQKVLFLISFCMHCTEAIGSYNACNLLSFFGLRI